MLGLDNPLHIAFILVLLLLVFGAKRLPELGKSLGTGLRGFKESISGEEPTSHLSEADDQARVDDLALTHPTSDEQGVEHTPMRPSA
jgi:sec-independent protein translocase protein TatA